MSAQAIFIKENPEPYRLSFICGGLMPHYSAAYIELYRQTGDWETSRRLGQERNLVQARSMSSNKRLGSELILRLRHLKEGELDFFPNADCREQNYLLWLAICRTYRFIADFMNQVTAHKLFSGDTCLCRDDFNIFFSQQAISHIELERLASSSRLRMGFNLFQMLREAAIIDNSGAILRISAGSEFQTLFLSLPREEQLFFRFDQ